MSTLQGTLPKGAPGLGHQEIPAGTSSIEAVQTSIIAMLVYTDFGIANKPVLITDEDTAMRYLGYYRNDSFSMYNIVNAFREGAKQIYAVRVVGDNARRAMGADGYKITEQKASFTHGTGNSGLTFTANTGGETGLDISIEITTGSGSGETVTVDGKDIKVEMRSGGATATQVKTALDADTTASALITTTLGGDGSGTVSNLVKTFLSGVGAINISVNDSEFKDTVTSGIDFVTSKVIPGDVLVIFNGDNQGAYLISEVTGENSLEVEEDFKVTQSDCLYAIMGTSGKYGHLRVKLLHEGSKGKNVYVKLGQEVDKQTIYLKVYRDDEIGNQTKTWFLEQFRNQKTATSDAAYIENIVNGKSQWVDIDFKTENILFTASTGAGAGTTSFTDSSVDFIQKGVSVGDVLYITSGSGTKGSYSVMEVNQHTLVLNRSVATATGLSYLILIEDTDGSRLLNKLSTEKTVNLKMGVDDIPDKDDYIGNQALKTGLYALDNLDNIGILTIPDAPIIYDGTGADATKNIHLAVQTYITARQDIFYIMTSEFGETPSTVTSTLDNWGLDNRFTAFYYPWIKIDDPLTGSTKYIPPAGDMAGVYARVDNGDEGVHKAPANEILYTAIGLEYDVNTNEQAVLNPKGINVIRKPEGRAIKIYGARTISLNQDYKWIHKRRTYIMLWKSIVNALKPWAPFMVYAPDKVSKILTAIKGFFNKYDRRFVRNGSLFDMNNPSAVPYSVMATSGSSESELIVRWSAIIVNTMERIIVESYYWNGQVITSEG